MSKKLKTSIDQIFRVNYVHCNTLCMQDKSKSKTDTKRKLQVLVIGHVYLCIDYAWTKCRHFIDPMNTWL